jgi:hypothetical protein
VASCGRDLCRRTPSFLLLSTVDTTQSGVARFSAALRRTFSCTSIASLLRMSIGVDEVIAPAIGV